MTRIQRLMRLHRLMKPAGDDGSDAGGSGAGAGDEAAAAAAIVAAAAAAASEAETAAAAAALAGKTTPSAEEAKLLKEVMNKKTALAAANTELARVTALLDTFTGIDVVKVRVLLAEAEAAEEKKAIAAGDFERLTKQMGERHTADKAGVQTLLDAATLQASGLQKQIENLTIGSAFTGSKFVAEDLLLPSNKARALYGSHFEFKDGEAVGYDKPAGAPERTLLVDASGAALKFDVAMRKIVEADPDGQQMLRSKVKPGSSGGGQKKTGKETVETNENLTPTERIARGMRSQKELALKNGGK